MDKLKELIEVLKEHNKDSRGYLNEFYKKCQNNEVDDMNWVDCDSGFEDFIISQPMEYNRIYDKAILDITNKLLILLNK